MKWRSLLRTAAGLAFLSACSPSEPVGDAAPEPAVQALEPAAQVLDPAATASAESNQARPMPGDADYRPASEPGMVRIGDRGYFLSSALWPSTNIPVCWELAPGAYANERRLVESAVRSSWQANSRLQFSQTWSQCGAAARGIRIAVADTGPHTKGLGKELDGKPAGMVLNFTFENWSRSCKPQRDQCIVSIAVHEFGHALGFAHEQNRGDTPGECLEPPQGTSGDQILTPWDAQSVMNYCNPVYNNRGVLSNGDKRSVAAKYGQP